MLTGRVVSKRGGRRESFVLAKLQRALDSAALSCADGACFVAEELLASVEARLPFAAVASDPSRSREVESASIRQVVERLLEQRGLLALLSSYRRHAARRERQRVQLRVAIETRAVDASSSSFDGVVASDPFDCARIVAHLALHRSYARELALEIAHAVERRLLAAGWTTIGRDLVAATVQAECAARQLATAGSARRDLIGPRRSEIDELLDAGCTRDGEEVTSWGQSVEQTLAAMVLARYSSSLARAAFRGEESTSDLRRSASAHLRGDLHFLHADAPHRRLAAMVAFAPDAFDPALLTERLAEALCAQTRRVSLLVDLRSACQGRLPYKRVRLLLAEQIPVWSAIARAAGGRLSLNLLAATNDVAVDRGAAVDGGLAELVRAAEALIAPRAQVFDAVEIVTTAAIADAWSMPASAAASALPLPALRFGSAQRWNLGFGVLLHGALEAFTRGELEGSWNWGAAGGVALNLPRLAAKVGSADEGAFFAGLHALLETSVCEARSQEARGDRRARACLGPAWLPATHASFAVVPIGFAEALQILWGEVTPPRAARALSFLSEATERFGQQSGGEWMLELGDAPEARQRFERLDEACEESVARSGYASSSHDGRRYGYGTSPARCGAGLVDRHLPSLLSYGRVPARQGAPLSSSDLFKLDLRVSMERRNESP